MPIQFLAGGESMESKYESAICKSTLRMQDIVCNIMAFLEMYYPKTYKKAAVILGDYYAKLLSSKSSDFGVSYDVYQDLIDIMESMAPEGYFFGDHNGQLGFWKSTIDG